MRALQMTSPAADSGATRVAEMEEPSPGRGELSIDVAFAGVNFMDVMARRGDRGYVSGWPYVPGLEVAGTIRAVGEEAGEWQPGDRVAAFTAGGGFAEVAIAQAALTSAVPPNVGLEVATAAPLVLSTAVLLLENAARIRPGESLLMHSASGGLGSAVPQVAAAMHGGLRIGVVGSPAKVPAATAAGWDHAVPAGESAAPAIREVAPAGIDVILDPGGTANLHLDLATAAPGGRIVLFGNPAGGTPAPLPPMGRLIGGNLGIHGFSISSLSRDRPATVAQALRHSLSLLADSRVRLEVTVADDLGAVPVIHDLMAARQGSGKYVARVG
jgi:NADPH2:quinone reductase